MNPIHNPILHSPLKTKSPLEIHVTHSFIIPSEFHPSLSEYYILKWTGEYLQSLYSHTSGVFSHQDVSYQMIWHNKKMKQILEAKKVLVSFRRIKGEKNGYAMIKEFKE